MLRSNGSLVSTYDYNFYFVISPNTKIKPVVTPVHEAWQLYYDCPTECVYLRITSPTVTIIGNVQQVVCDMLANRRLGIMSIKKKKIHWCYPRESANKSPYFAEKEIVHGRSDWW